MIYPKRTRNDISINKVIGAMINYKITSLIPATHSVMYRVYKKFRDNLGLEPYWPVTGRPPILDDNSFFYLLSKDLRKIKVELFQRRI